MTPIKVMINGLPGNVAAIMARHAVGDPRFTLLQKSLTGPEITKKTCEISDVKIDLIPPGQRDEAILELIKAEGPFISIDYTHPSAVIENARFYCQHKLPFVMGTTGGDRAALENMVAESSIQAVIAPNMAKQIVGVQAMMDYAAQTFPGLFDGYSLEIKESHQKGKADTSGTARAMVGYFNGLGIPFEEDEIIKIREPDVQKNELGVPEEYLKGHGWHTYALDSKDKTVHFEFSHNINGRDVYAGGTFDAVIFLQSMLAGSKAGRVFSMIDVLKKK